MNSRTNRSPLAYGSANGHIEPKPFSERSGGMSGEPRNDGACLPGRISSAVDSKTSGSERFEAWTRNYAPLAGIPDEFMDANGQARPHWRRMLSTLAEYEPNEIQQSFATADRRIRNRGLSYRVAGEKDERVWPISRMPLLLTEEEWRGIADGVAQRAELLEEVLADVYGEGRLVVEGALPPAALTGSKDYIAAMRGVRPPGGRWLRLYAVDIGRGPDGSWWALSDRAQAPSGCGYALENRLVVSQAFPDLYAQLNVERLAPFFRSLSAGLKSAGQRTEPRIGILTPGPLSLTYFEQAYLARYLGFLLVEGEDLLMRDGRVFVRTIAGLKQCDVIWRHIDADWCDPLELNASSRIGVPGLLEAIRRGGVAVENMPGAGLVESRALLAFLPVLARRLLKRDLLIPNIATWWCGQPRERERVLDEFDKISIATAFGEELPGISGQSSVVGARTRQQMNASACVMRSPCAGWTLSDRILFDCLRRRAGQMGNSSHGPSCCASTAPRLRTAGASCQADFAVFPIALMLAPSRWAMASNPPTSGCSPKIQSRFQVYFPLQKAHELRVF